MVKVMVEEKQKDEPTDPKKTEEWLCRIQRLVPQALDKAKRVKGFSVRWRMIVSKLEQFPTRLSDLSSHPCFSKNAVCKEQLQAVSGTLVETIALADKCIDEKFEGKLRMQSDLDSLTGKLDLNLRDCALLIKTGVLSSDDDDAIMMTTPAVSSTSSSEDSTRHGNLKELLARLQIGDLGSKHRALDALVEATKEDGKNVSAVLGRSSAAALVQLLTVSSTRVREKAAAVICSLAESGICEDRLVSEGVVPPLIRLVESGSAMGKEKAAISLQRLSMSHVTARVIVGHGGVRPLVDICQAGGSVIIQAASAGTLRNISAVPEVRQSLAEEGVVRAMIDLLDSGLLLASREYAADCLQNLTASNESLRRSVIQEGGIRSLLAYLDDGLLPQEPAVSALRNLVGGSVSMEALESLEFLPRLTRVFKSGSTVGGAQRAAASAICKISNTPETKKMVGESGFVPLLIKMLGAETNAAREVSAQALSSLMTLSQNCREAKRNDECVPNLVQLLDPSPVNTAKKYAVSCLVAVSSSKKCRKLMVSYGAIGYLKKLVEMDVPGARKLLDRLDRRRKLKNLFSRK